MKVKICGIKSEEAAIAVEEGGADFLGIIFVKGRTRYLDPESAFKLCKNHRKIKKVGVFLRETYDEVNRIAAETGIDYVQLHGYEDTSYAKKIKLPIIKAFRCDDDFDVKRINNYPCEIALIDSFNAKVNGGTGETFNWLQAKSKIECIRKPLFLAGGISEENIEELKSIFPSENIGVDVSSSLEINNCKSPQKIMSFLNKVQSI